MHHKLFALIISLLLTFIFPAWIQAQENFEVRQVSFRGNKTLEEDFLLERMALKEVSWLEKVLTKNEPFLYNEELVKVDLERLTRVYQSQGFLKADVRLLPLKVKENKETVKITFEIDEGEPVKVDTVTLELFEENDSINIDSLRNNLLKDLELKQGERFRDEAIKSDKQAIDYAFRNLGYAYANTSYSLDLNAEKMITEIHFSVYQGPKAYVGETTISGNKHVSDNFIQKQLQYEKGELYNKSLLNETRENLYRLQLFRVVSVLPQKNAQSGRSPIPVDIYIEEAPRLSTRFGAGYGTEDKFRTFLDLNYRGFLGGARRINLYLKHSALVPYSAHLRWIQPQFLSTNSSITLNPFIERKSEPGFETRTYGLNVPFTYRFNDWLSSKLTYYFEDVEQRVEAGDEEFQNIEDEKFPYNKSGFLFSTVFDNSNPTFSPEEGFNISVGFKFNGYIFGSDFNYTRLWGDFRTYHDVGSVVLAFRLMAGGISSADSSNFIPVEDRFYSGGSNSIRGWSRSELGPKRESGTPQGGKSIFESNFEVRYPLFWRLSAVAFFEAGNVWRPSYSYNLGDLGYAAGPGLRIETPIGPVRLDLGFPLWNEKTSPAFFISVGQAF
jgi:outer membrane protein insertion porin family